MRENFSSDFNKKYERTGTLFEGRFKASHAGEDRYLAYLFSYIHLNPIKLINHDWRDDSNFHKNKAGEFLDNHTIHGVTSNSSWSLVSYDPLNVNLNNDQYDNQYIETQGNSITDFSESNPFGSI